MYKVCHVFHDVFMQSTDDENSRGDNSWHQTPISMQLYIISR